MTIHEMRARTARELDASARQAAPIRTVRITTGKTAAYAVAESLRKTGAVVSTISIRGSVYEVRVWADTQAVKPVCTVDVPACRVVDRDPATTPDPADEARWAAQRPARRVAVRGEG